MVPDFPVAFYAVATFAVLITGVAKGAFGQGSGGIAVPLMAMFIAPNEAAGIMLPILCAMDLFSVHAYRGKWSRAHLAILLPGALVGIALGAIAFGALPVNGVRLLLGLISVTFALNQWFRFTERIAARLAAERGRAFIPGDTSFASARAARLDVLGDLVAGHLDTARLAELIEAGPPEGLPDIRTEVRPCFAS